MKLIGRGVGLLLGAFTVVSVAGAVVAAFARTRLPKVDEAGANEIHLAAVFEPLAFASTASAFRGGSIDTWYGGGLIDLRNAVLDPAGARLMVRAVFGGAQIAVPDDWCVVSEVRGLGGVGDERPERERPYDAPRLIIGGTVVFGGFGITTELPEHAMESLREAGARRRTWWHKEAETTAEPIGPA